jgi:uncharacterized membrane protein
MIVPPEILIFLLAMAPISELRGAIPTGILIFNLPFWKVFLISFLGNLIPVFFLLLFLEPVSNFLSKKSNFFKKIINWFFKRTRKKVDDHIKKYEEIGLVIFVAIPFPLTGGWSGAIAAFLLGLPFKVAFPLVSLGVLIAGVIVSVLTTLGIAIEKYFGWATLFGVFILILFCWFFYRFFSKKVKKKFNKK